MKNSIEEPFEITIKSHGATVTYKLERSDIDIEKLIDAFVSVAMASGWSKELLQEYIDVQI